MPKIGKPASLSSRVQPSSTTRAQSASQPINSGQTKPRETTAKTEDLRGQTVIPGDVLTANQGVRISDDQHALKAGDRGPTLLEDFHLREKITHFDHERIPERVVHARGVAAHGYFQVYEDFSDLTAASVLRDPSKKTPVFVRFSTVAGSRGSADTPRDVRGFAVKMYTDEGIWDIVGNNIPVFFIQEAIKFPDLIHAVKPEPNNEIPQAASAHDTFWDFISLTPESAHMLMWVMSDRALPRSLAMMEGFGIHTFRLINDQGKSRFVKFHWKPVKGVHSLVWDESQKIAGKDPDFHRRDLFDAIERGDFPEWELGLQIVEEEDELKFDFDLLDATKLIPEELVPIRRVGRMVLNRNPDNYFAETEQVAFCTSHIVPGIDFSNDPLLQGRLFSYLDTQLKRVGPNFAELPINRPLCPVHNNQRDGQGRTTINEGRVSYFPNRLGNGCPMQSPKAANAFRSYPQKVGGSKIQERSESFSDHFTQASMFWNSMADWEKEHIAASFSFELNQVQSEEVRHHVMNELLVNIADELAAIVSAQTGIAVQPIGTPQNPTPSAPDPSGPLRPEAKNARSPALSMDKPATTIKGRKIALLGGEGMDGEQLEKIKTALMEQGCVAELIAAHAGTVKDASGRARKVDRAMPNAPSVVYDSVIVLDGASAAALERSGLAIHFVNETYRHGKPLAFMGDGKRVLKAAAFEAGESNGVVVAQSVSGITEFIKAMHHHRFPHRVIEQVPA